MLNTKLIIQVGAELAYFKQEFGASFERTYGWAWLLKLQEELEASAEVLIKQPFKAGEYVMLGENHPPA